MVKTLLKSMEDEHEIIESEVPVLLPHRILQFLFEAGLRIKDEVLRKYWEHAKEAFPWAASEEFDGTHYPLALYGDTARFGQGYDQSKVTGFWMSLVLWRPKSTRMSQWLLWALHADRSLGARSHNPLYLVVVKSLNYAFHGESPDGWRCPRKFCVTELKGDWEFMYRTLLMKQGYWGARYMCWRCCAENHSNPRHSYLDLSENPSWTGTELSHNEFMSFVIPDDDVCAFVAGSAYCKVLMLHACFL